MSKIVHMVGDDEGARLPEGEVPSVRTRCGRTIDHPVITANVGPTRYDLVARNGNIFFCATRTAFVTCVKCRNLLTTGTSIYAKPREPGPDRPLARNASGRQAGAAIAQKRAVVTAADRGANAGGRRRRARERLAASYRA